MPARELVTLGETHANPPADRGPEDPRPDLEGEVHELAHHSDDLDPNLEPQLLHQKVWRHLPAKPDDDPTYDPDTSSASRHES